MSKALISANINGKRVVNRGVSRGSGVILLYFLIFNKLYGCLTGFTERKQLNNAALALNPDVVSSRLIGYNLILIGAG
jgi:hypothetical protein